MSSKTLLILNPASGRGATRRRTETLLARTQAICGPFELATTAAVGDATRFARSAAERGVERLLVAGGDGTTGEVVTGLLSADVANATMRPSLGLLPIGSGCDLARTLGLPRRLDAALELIAAGHLRPLDAGRVELADARGGRQVRYFANEVSAGLSGDTLKRSGGPTARLGPRLGFLLGAVAAVATHVPFEAALDLDGDRVYEGAISLFAVANGCYFGAGMRVAPGAVCDDGLLEVVLARGLSRSAILAHLPSFYLGRHGSHPRVSFHAATRVALLPKSGDVAVEVDGEGGFALPLRVDCLPAALNVFTAAATIPLRAPLALPALPRPAAPLAFRRERT